MEFGPIWRASMRNKTGALLVVLQVALTMTLIVNAVAIASRQASLMGRPIGMDEVNTFHVRSAGISDNLNARYTIEEDLRIIRATPGVEAVTQINWIPLGGSGMSMGLQTEAGQGIEQAGTAVYMVDEHGLDALGVELIAGEGFTDADVEWRDGGTSSWPAKVILTRDLAEALFPDDPTYGVGQIVYIAQTQPMTVAGIVARLQAPWNGWNNIERSILVPRHVSTADVRYLIRAEPGRRDSLIPEIEQMLAERERGRIVQDLLTMEQTREQSYDVNSALVNILNFTVVVIVAITTLGVGGLTNFNVTRRVKQIGTRRALGASRAAILRFFLAENLLFTLIGVGLGAILSIAVNYWLVSSFSVPRFSWVFLPLVMVGLVAISQLAVLAPARRAARVAPAVATRTV